MLWLTDVLHVGSIEFVVQVKNFWYISRQALIGQLLLVRLGSTWTATSCLSRFGERLLHVTCPLGFLNVTICSFERKEAAINEFQPFKPPGPDGLYPVLLQKGWNQLKGYYCVIFQACLRHSYVPSAWKEGSGIFLPKPGTESYFEAKSFRMITLTSFQLKWLEKLNLYYHINEDNNLLAKLSASQNEFRAGVSAETALHEFGAAKNFDLLDKSRLYCKCQLTK